MRSSPRTCYLKAFSSVAPTTSSPDSIAAITPSFISFFQRKIEDLLIKDDEQVLLLGNARIRGVTIDQTLLPAMQANHSNCQYQSAGIKIVIWQPIALLSSF